MVTPMTNEELAERIRGGDADSIEKILQNNQEYLYKLARRLSNNPDMIEDLVQEGSIAILGAAGSYEPERGTLFLTYATPMIKKATRSFMAKMSLPMAIPAARYSQLRKVNYLVAKFQMESENGSLQDLLLMICQEMDVSESVARRLLWDFSTVFQEVALNEQWEQSIPCIEADLAKVYEKGSLAECIQAAFDELAPRERVLIQQYLGLDVGVCPNRRDNHLCSPRPTGGGNTKSSPKRTLPDGAHGDGMTFQELAVMLNYNGHSSAEKAYNRAVKSLRQALYAGEYGEYIWARQAITGSKRKMWGNY